jgi:hypothetical protein
MKSNEEILAELQHFNGTEMYHKFSMLSQLVITDGVKYLSNEAKSYWLLDLIASYQRKCQKDPMLKDFQIWTIKAENNKATITCERDTNDIAFTQKIPYTDFPLRELKLYCENGVIYLPQER